MVQEEEDAKELREGQAAREAAARLKNIKVWSEVADNFELHDREVESTVHKERLARYRKRHDWEQWVEEDELDLEGDRLLSEIKNFKSEFVWNTRFYN